MIICPFFLRKNAINVIVPASQMSRYPDIVSDVTVNERFKDVTLSFWNFLTCRFLINRLIHRVICRRLENNGYLQSYTTTVTTAVCFCSFVFCRFCLHCVLDLLWCLWLCSISSSCSVAAFPPFIHSFIGSFHSTNRFPESGASHPDTNVHPQKVCEGLSAVLLFSRSSVEISRGVFEAFFFFFKKPWETSRRIAESMSSL